MRIGLLSDTHCLSGRALPAEALRALTGVDLVLHAGDVTGEEVLRKLEDLAPVVAVKGNCDLLRLPERRVVTVGRYRIGLQHVPPLAREAEALARGFGEPLDCVVSGHTHCSRVERFEGTLFVNPGSPRHPRDGWASVAILEAGETLEAHIVRLREIRGGD